MSINDEAAGRWSSGHRIAFRFVFVYVLLYLTTFPVSMLPFGMSLGDVRLPAWDVVVPWAAQEWFGVRAEPVPYGAGGDLVFNYVQALCCAVIAIGAALVWSILDRRSTAYPRLAGALRVVVRYVLAITMLQYGFQKVFMVQFPAPGTARMLQTYGESSPSGLLWTFMGFSPVYTIFAGVMEVLGAMLLLRRRTATLGALVLCGVLVNVVMLNFCYDVGVKLFSLHLLAMALLVAAPDMKRLADVLVYNRPVAARVTRHACARPPRWRRAAAGVAAVVIGGGAFVAHAWQNYGYFASVPRMAAATPIDGVYRVERIEREGEAAEGWTAAEPESGRWQRVVVEMGSFVVQRADGGLESYFAAGEMAGVNDAAGTSVMLTSWAPPGYDARTWAYSQPRPGTLVVEGKVEGVPITMVLTRADAAPFLLTSRGFNWVADEAYWNR